MRRLSLTYFGFMIFVIVFFLSYKTPNGVSQITVANEYRKAFSVKQENSRDAQVGIGQVIPPSEVSNRQKFANHVRNLRVFISPNNVEGGELALYLEQVKPHQFFIVYGPFSLDAGTKFRWDGPTTFSFYATGTDRLLKHYSINVHEPSLHMDSILQD